MMRMCYGWLWIMMTEVVMDHDERLVCAVKDHYEEGGYGS